MFPQGIGTPPVGQYTTSAINQQNADLLGAPPIQKAAMPTMDPGMFNSTAFQSNPAALSMVNALKGGM